MPTVRRNRIVASRRRAGEEGEEEAEEATIPVVEDDSLSEGSAPSTVEDDDGDIEPSENSGEEIALSSVKCSQLSGSGFSIRSEHSASRTGLQDPHFRSDPPPFSQAPTRKQVVPDGADQREPNLEDSESCVNADTIFNAESTSKRSINQNPVGNKSRRDQKDYLKQRENPTFVPNRGGFFLHDDRGRTYGPATRKSGMREPGGGRGTGRYFRQSGLGPFADSMNRPWTHDLHDSVSKIASGSKAAKPLLGRHGPTSSNNTENPAASVDDTLSKTFSTTLILGQVPVIISLPEMRETRVVQNVKRQKHTILPHHRPPLRRDKPIRVFLPGQQPRYVSPTNERSFIFLSRTFRSHRDGIQDGARRNNFHLSHRRYRGIGGGNTSSLEVSGKLSVADEVPSEKIGPSAAEPGESVARFSSSVPATVLSMSVNSNLRHDDAELSNFAASIEHDNNEPESIAERSAMDQARPNVSIPVSDLDSAEKLQPNLPMPSPALQQQQQPFHQQMPPLVNRPAQSEDDSPLYDHNRVHELSQMAHDNSVPAPRMSKEAIYAQPFQPAHLPAVPQAYMPFSQAPGNAFYAGTEHYFPMYYPGYDFASVPPMFPSHVPPPPEVAIPPALPISVAYPTPAQPTTSLSEHSANRGTIAHESNGMVYYLNPSATISKPVDSYPVGFPVSAPETMETDGVMPLSSQPYYPATTSAASFTAP